MYPDQHRQLLVRANTLRSEDVHAQTRLIHLVRNIQWILVTRVSIARCILNTIERLWRSNRREPPFSNRLRGVIDSEPCVYSAW